MRLRDIFILAGLVLLILGLTVLEKYAERRREERRSEESAQEWSRRQEQIMTAFEDRWRDLSAGVRATLDSLADATVAGGVPAESLATVVIEVPAETVWVDRPAVEEAETEVSVTPVETATAEPAMPDPDPDPEKQLDSLAVIVAKDYRAALAALPTDLNAYEQRVATNEVASVLRAKYNLSSKRFDDLLKRAVKLEGSDG